MAGVCLTISLTACSSSRHFSNVMKADDGKPIGVLGATLLLHIFLQPTLLPMCGRMAVFMYIPLMMLILPVVVILWIDIMCSLLMIWCIGRIMVKF